MRICPRKRRNDAAGGALLEAAFVLPLLLLLLIGAVDFGRAFYNSITVSNAAGIATFYGSQSISKSGHYDRMAQVARDDAGDVAPVTAAADRFCACPNGTQVDCITGTCAGYGAPRVYVRCQVRKNFDTLVNLPRVPDGFTIARTTFMRVQ